MKNLILTVGILSLMTMGILYESNFLNLILQKRQMEWICTEMADAAVLSLERMESWPAAETAAGAILKRNSGEEESLVWNLEKEGNTITVKVTVSPCEKSLQFFGRGFQIRAAAEAELS